MALDAEDKAEIKSMLDEAFGTLPGTVTRIVQAQTKGLLKADDVDKLLKDRAKDDPPKDPPSGGDPPGDDPKDAGELAKLRREMAEMRRQAEADRQRAEAAEAARKQADRDAKLMHELETAGVNPHQRVALKHMLLGEGQVKVSEDGEVVFVQTDQYGTSEVALAKGLKTFLESDVGKSFMPPRDKRGTGDGNPGDGNVGDPNRDTVTRTPAQIVMGALDRMGREG